jgi:hypothetical protein
MSNGNGRLSELAGRHVFSHALAGFLLFLGRKEHDDGTYPFTAVYYFVGIGLLLRWAFQILTAQGAFFISFRES